MTPNHLALTGSVHLRHSFRLAFGTQTAGDLLQIRFWKGAGGAKQNSIAGFFDRELGARPPQAGSTYVLGQDNLALGGEPGGFHW
jgi:hypothetical protein